MASVERRGRRFRVAFRLGENKFHVSLKTSGPQEAEACLAPLKGRQKEPFRIYDQIQKMISRGGLLKRQIRELWDGLSLHPLQVAKVLEYVKQNAVASWLHPFLVTVAHTGARRSELFRVQLDDFDFINRVVFVREEEKPGEGNIPNGCDPPRDDSNYPT